MHRYEFTFSFMKPYVYVFKVEVDAYNDNDAYYQALYEIARNVVRLHRDFVVPDTATITCVRKEVNGLSK